ncbi:hypothetical protein OESDEN_22967, partial [Oesophagostomum dentatum]
LSFYIPGCYYQCGWCISEREKFSLNFFLEYLYCLQKSQQSDAPLEWLTDDCQLHGFHWRAGAKRDTVGIWIWGEPIMIEAASGEMYAVLLVQCICSSFGLR